MRLPTLALLVLLAAATPAAGQTSPDANPYGLDPYKPSDAALLRAFGTTLVSQTALPELASLDPYKPSHAALLRQIGGGLPLWGLAWFPLQAPGPVMPLLHIASTPPGMPGPAARADRRSPRRDAPDEGLPPPFWMATLQRPETNDGVWITFAGARWIASGKAIPFEASAFEQVGTHGTFPVYRGSGSADGLIYLPTRDGLITPYRAKETP
jgi:hypothetical protein